MHLKNIRAIDLNLLKVFYALYTERHVTRAGAAVGLSQPAVSHALRRLRHIFDDELFVRSQTGMVPTVRCEAVFESVRQALNDLDLAMGLERPFDPSTAEFKFRIGMNDQMNIVLLPHLVERVLNEAPKVDLRVTHSLVVVEGLRRPTDALLDLDEGRTDLALVQETPMPNRFTREKFFEMDFVCVGRKENKSFNKNMDSETFERLGHVMVTPADLETSHLDSQFEAIGLKRNIKVRVPHYAAAVGVVAQTDLVHIMPRLLASVAVKHYGFQVAEVPIKSPTRNFYQVWLKTRTSDPGHAWMRNLISECVEKIASDT